MPKAKRAVAEPPAAPKGSRPWRGAKPRRAEYAPAESNSAVIEQLADLEKRKKDGEILRVTPTRAPLPRNP